MIYQCKLCGKTFEFRKLLRKHLREIHKTPVDEIERYIIDVMPRVPIDESEDLSDIDVMLVYKE
jgi:hypothetical protein